MIKSFKHKGLESFFLTGSTKGIQAIHQRKLSNMLTVLNRLTGLKDIPPVWKLHPLKGDMEGQWAITVQANWRITFEFEEHTKDVYIVDYKDYH